MRERRRGCDASHGCALLSIHHAGFRDLRLELQLASIVTS